MSSHTKDKSERQSFFGGKVVMTDKISDNLIDEILSDVKTYTGESEPETIYSAEDIDLLLADIMGTDSDTEKESVDIVSDTVKKTESVDTQYPEKNIFSIDVQKLQSVDDEAVAEDETEVPVLVGDDGQFGFVSDIPVEVAEEETEEEIKEDDTVQGQISIEKTRMFNEVDIRGAYNPEISHNLGNRVTRTTSGDAQPLSSSTMSEEKYRKHFMNKPVQKIENTMEQRAIRNASPQKTIETPGMVVKNRAVKENTDGIRPLPTIVPAEYELQQERTMVINQKKPDNQIMFDGFGDDEDIMQQSEEQAEAELREHRKEAVEVFVNGDLPFKEKVESPPVKRRYERQKVKIAREYFGPNDADAVKNVFAQEKKDLVIKLAVVSAICFVMSILSMIAGADNGNFEIYGNNELVYSAVQLLFLVIASVINYKSFANAISNIRSLVFNMDTVVTVSAIVGALQCIVSFGSADSVESVASLTTGAAVLPMVMKLAGELVRCKNDSDNFDIITEEDYPCHCVENVADENVAIEIARGLMMGNPEIKYSAKTEFPQSFIEISRSAEVTGPICKITIPAMLGVGLVLGIVTAVMTKNLFAAISALTSTVLIGLPCSAGLISAINLRTTNKMLNEQEAIINGYNAVEEAVNTNGVVIDACDVFEQGGCNIEGMKTYHKMRIDEAILYAASVVIASGGVLADVFEGVIIGKKELLLPVESLVYEEKLGCSCWIHNHRVLVGNRDLLVHHNVETPDKDLEEKFKANGRNVVYLAIEGKISAMFVVVYKANPETAKYIRELEKDGVTIFFRTADANITEKFLEREFQLPANVVKIIDPVAGEMFSKVKARYADRRDARIVHNGSMMSMLAAIHGTFIINSLVNSSRLIQVIASIVGALIIAIFTFLSGVGQIGVWQIILYQIIWAGILAVPAITRKK